MAKPTRWSALSVVGAAGLKRLAVQVKRIPGGQTSGNALISANVAAFESYGLEASLIAPTCGADCGERFSKAANALIENAELISCRAAGLPVLDQGRKHVLGGLLVVQPGAGGGPRPDRIGVLRQGGDDRHRHKPVLCNGLFGQRRPSSGARLVGARPLGRPAATSPATSPCNGLWSPTVAMDGSTGSMPWPPRQSVNPAIWLRTSPTPCSKWPSKADHCPALCSISLSDEIAQNKDSGTTESIFDLHALGCINEWP